VCNTMISEALRLAWYRFRSTFGRRRGSYLALILLVGLVGGLAMGSWVAARRTESSYPAFLTRTNPSSLLVQPTTTVDCASGFVREIARLPHVKNVECALALNAETLTSSGGLGTILLTRVELVASKDGLFSDQDRVTITQGRTADPTRSDEIVISPTAAGLFHLHVGSHLSVGVDTSNQMNFVPPYRTLDLRVVGEGVFDNRVVQDDIDKGHWVSP
jgi:hypothetical protein